MLMTPIGTGDADVRAFDRAIRKLVRLSELKAVIANMLLDTSSKDSNAHASKGY